MLGKNLCRSGKLLVIYYSYVELRVYCKINIFIFFIYYLINLIFGNIFKEL